MLKIKKLFKCEKDLEKILKLSHLAKIELKDYRLVKANTYKLIDGVPTDCEISITDDGHNERAIGRGIFNVFLK